MSSCSRADVAEICRRLDGVTLALEIAASFVDFTMVSGVRESLGERLKLLRLNEGAAAERHASLHGIVDWGYEKLDPAEQRVFCRLGIFPGWFTAAEAVAIAGDDQTDAFAVLRNLVPAPSSPPSSTTTSSSAGIR